MNTIHQGAFVNTINYPALIKMQSTKGVEKNIDSSQNLHQTLKGGRQKQMSLGTRKQRS